jgi:regulatory protein
MHIPMPHPADKTENIIQTANRLALRYLKYRPHSCAEMRLYLKGKNIPAKTIDHLIARFKSSGLLDDRDFARQWLESRRRFKPKGAYALKAELKQKGIHESIIDDVLAGDDEGENARAAVASRHKRWRHLDKAGYRKKVFNFLRSRGFSFQTCSELGDLFFNEKPEKTS